MPFQKTVPELRETDPDLFPLQKAASILFDRMPASLKSSLSRPIQTRIAPR
jgi:hypothetical protein